MATKVDLKTTQLGITPQNIPQTLNVLLPPTK